MAWLKDLPVELLFNITCMVESCGDLSSFAKTGRRFCKVANPILYKQAVKQRFALLHWAVDAGEKGTFDKALSAGIYIDTLYVYRAFSPVGTQTRLPPRQEYTVSDATSSAAAISPTIVISWRRNRKIMHQIAYTALHLAVFKGDNGMIQFIIERGGGLEAEATSLTLLPCGPRGHRHRHPSSAYYWDNRYRNAKCTALHIAIAKGHNQTVRLLLERGALLDFDQSTPVHSNNKRTALQSAAHAGNIEALRLIAEVCPPWMFSAEYYGTHGSPLEAACCHEARIMEEADDKEYEAQDIDDKCFTWLMRHPNVELKREDDIVERVLAHQLPVVFALELLDLGANASQAALEKTIDGNRDINYATVIKSLIQRDALGTRAPEDYLAAAVDSENLFSIKALLEVGVDPNVASNWRWAGSRGMSFTALERVCENISMARDSLPKVAEMVRCLLAFQANPLGSPNNDSYLTPLQVINAEIGHLLAEFPRRRREMDSFSERIARQARLKLDDLYDAKNALKAAIRSQLDNSAGVFLIH